MIKKLIDRLSNAYESGRDTKELELELNTIQEAPDLFSGSEEGVKRDIDAIVNQKLRYGILERLAYNLGYIRG